MGNRHTAGMFWCHFSPAATSGFCPCRSQGYMETAHGSAWLSCWCIWTSPLKHTEICLERELDQPHLPTLPCQLVLAWRSPKLVQADKRWKTWLLRGSFAQRGSFNAHPHLPLTWQSTWITELTCQERFRLETSLERCLSLGAGSWLGHRAGRGALLISASHWALQTLSSPARCTVLWLLAEINEQSWLKNFPSKQCFCFARR